MAKERSQGKQKEQYHRIWDNYETIKQTKRVSCVLMKVERSFPEYPAKFQRLYFSLTAMKRGFIARCRATNGLDGCFLK
jgi:hypothetical protein